MKRCGRCGESKPLDAFYRDKHRPDGRRHACRSCCAAQYQDLRIQKDQRCPDCDKQISPYRTRCLSCSTRQERSGRWKGGRCKDPKGYVIITGQQGHPNARKGGQIPEHVLVMTEHLGRPLLPEENVHHKNGIRDDNRIENLELWTTSQPSGQRVEDKVAWAREILALYSPEVLGVVA